jgi:hypothetical protein
LRKIEYLKKYLFILIIFFFFSDAYCQSLLKKISNDLSIYVSGNYVSSATIQINPYSSDIIERNTTDELSGGYGYGLAIKKKILGDNLFFSLSTEFLQITDNSLVQELQNDTSFVRARVTESLKFIPLEFALYFNLPQALEDLNIFLGGGAGIYFGDRTRKMAGFETVTTSKSPTVNIVVLFGMEYFMDKHFSLLLEMRVRQGEYKVSNHFPTNHLSFQGQDYQFQQDFNSKIFVDGLKLSLGLGYTF